MINTNHRLVIGDAKNLETIQDESIDLVVTSPPYPMIGMWDKIFGLQNPEIKKLLDAGEGGKAFALMHRELDQVWNQVTRVLRKGGIACINIGDATRTIGGFFQLFANHARVLRFFTVNGFAVLPGIIWRKQTNAPNKFMGSGMLPPGAYITLEHEYILILRKGGKREFKNPREIKIRQESAYFWEERNSWFSDIWEDLKGVNQKLHGNKGRDKSAAYPFEMVQRLVNMFSVQGDMILDPFVGTGTTMLAAMCNQRNSIGVEIDGHLKDIITNRFGHVVPFSNEILVSRLRKHLEFIKNRIEGGREVKYTNEHYHFPVITRQETKLRLNLLERIQKNGSLDYTVFYKKGTVKDLAAAIQASLEFSC